MTQTRLEQKPPTPEQFGLTPTTLAEEQRKERLYRERQNPGRLTAGFAVAFVGMCLGAYVGLQASPQTGGFLWGGALGFLIGVLIAHPMDKASLEALKPNPAYKSYLEATDRFQKSQKQYWRDFSGWDFEHAMGDVLRRNGYIAHVTPGSGDGGVDIIARRDGRKIVIQCKAYSGKCGPGPVREIYGVIMHEQADEGWLVCLGGFSEGAVGFAQAKPIKLLGMDDVIRMTETGAF